MNNQKLVQWILRIAVAGEFIGHGMFALQGKEGWFKYFEAVDPERLLSFIDEQKEKLAEKSKILGKLIPDLRKQAVQIPSAEAHVLVGKEGFKTMRKDVLKQQKDLYLIGAKGKEDRALKYFFPNFDKLRIQNKIWWRVLFDHEVRDKNITKLPRQIMIIAYCAFLASR